MAPDLLLIVRDALASSLVGSLLAAIDGVEQGQTVGVLITQDALAALARGTFAWPRELSGQEMRLLVADRGAAAGLPVRGRGEGRQLDPKAMVDKAVAAGVSVFACPVWTSLLDLAGQLPSGVAVPDRAMVTALLRDARQVVGTL